MQTAHNITIIVCIDLKNAKRICLCSKNYSNVLKKEESTCLGFTQVTGLEENSGKELF